jgi:hypothetical protein
MLQAIGETWALVASGAIVHLAVQSMAPKLGRADITLIPIRDLPPIPLGLIWCTAHENGRIRALAQVASTAPAQ